MLRSENELSFEFYVFQLTTLFQRGPAKEIPRFEFSLDRVTISHCSIDSAVWCLQSFVRDLLFTHWGFFTDTGISMLLSAVNVAGGVCEDSVFDPWNVILPEGYGAIVNDLKEAYDVVVLHRKDAWDTYERWSGMASVESSVVVESASQQAFRIPNIVEVGEVEYMPQSVSTMQMPSTSGSTKSPGKGKRKKSESSTASNLMMSRWCCPRYGGFTLMSPILQLL